jgi:hypothetical protein
LFSREHFSRHHANPNRRSLVSLPGSLREAISEGSWRWLLTAAECFHLEVRFLQLDTAVIETVRRQEDRFWFFRTFLQARQIGISC